MPQLMLCFCCVETIKCGIMWSNSTVFHSFECGNEKIYIFAIY